MRLGALWSSIALEVLRGYRPVADQASLADFAVKFDARLDNFLEKRRDEAKAEKGTMYQTYAATFEDLLALEHALEGGLSLDLNDFVVERQVPQAREKDEEIYFVDCEELPEAFGRALGCKRRACRRVGDKTEFVVRWAHRGRKILFERIEQGLGWTARNFLYTVGGLRGSAFWDPCHRRHNTWHLALKSTPGLWRVYCQTTFLFSFRRGRGKAPLISRPCGTRPCGTS